MEWRPQEEKEVVGSCRVAGGWVSAAERGQDALDGGGHRKCPDKPDAEPVVENRLGLIVARRKKSNL